MYSSYCTICGLTSALFIQYLPFCSTFAVLCDEVRRQQRFEYSFDCQMKFTFDTQDFFTE